MTTSRGHQVLRRYLRPGDWRRDRLLWLCFPTETVAVPSATPFPTRLPRVGAGRQRWHCVFSPLPTPFSSLTRSFKVDFSLSLSQKWISRAVTPSLPCCKKEIQLLSS